MALESIKEKKALKKFEEFKAALAEAEMTQDEFMEKMGEEPEGPPPALMIGAPSPEASDDMEDEDKEEKKRLIILALKKKRDEE